MHKNGFMFLESLIVIVTLTTSLLLLYNTFKRIMDNEKRKKNYDEISYIYRSAYLKNNFFAYNKEILEEINDYQEIKLDSSYLNNSYLKKLFTDFEVQDLLILKKDHLKDLKECLNKQCLSLSSSFNTYIKTLNINIETDYVLLIEYQTCQNDKCQSYYSWMGV